ncbi:MAG: hypothetical protein HKN23_00925 [Verrucomicrobiales bacterium]|nr:hypothetical protein [Verrucomicrobiales bacterium]
MSAVTEFQPQFLDEDEEEPDVMIQFDADAFDPVTPYQEDFDDQVHVAQEQLMHLRQKQEALERQKTELEELSQRKEEFTAGRTRIVEELTRYIHGLEGESADAQRLADECLDTKEIFEHHMRTVECLRPESWSRTDLRGELARALGYIESAEDDISKAKPLLDSLGSKKKIFKSAAAAVSNATSVSGQPFSYWLKAGIAFTLPIMVFAIVFGTMMVIFGK